MRIRNTKVRKPAGKRKTTTRNFKPKNKNFKKLSTPTITTI
jgi:hypothetical protein